MRPLLQGHVLFSAFLFTFTVGAFLPCSAQERIKPVRVPFVGCKSDGQVGPLDAPTEPDRILRIDPNFAERLAYYKTEMGSGILAPRGWFCFGTYGSGGNSTYISPMPIDTSHVFSAQWHSYTGAAIEVDYRDGGTSGRDAVAQVVARVFPEYRAFAHGVVEMFDFLANDMVFQPYAADRLIYRSERVVEYRTPAHLEGLGTMTTRLKPDEQPIQGVALLLGDMPEISLLLLSIRVPPELSAFNSPIIRELEVEATARERLN